MQDDLPTIEVTAPTMFYFWGKLKPYLDLALTIVLDSCLIAFIMLLLHLLFKYALYLPDEDKHFVDNIKIIVHTSAIGLLSIFMIADFIRAIIKNCREIKKEWHKG